MMLICGEKQTGPPAHQVIYAGQDAVTLSCQEPPHDHHGILQPLPIVVRDLGQRGVWAIFDPGEAIVRNFETHIMSVTLAT